MYTEVHDDIPVDNEGFAEIFLCTLVTRNIDALLELYGDGGTVIDVVLNPCTQPSFTSHLNLTLGRASGKISWSTQC